MASTPPIKLSLAAFTSRLRDDASRFRIACERESARLGSDIFREMSREEWVRVFLRWLLEEVKGKRARPRSNITTVRRKS